MLCRLLKLLLAGLRLPGQDMPNPVQYGIRQGLSQGFISDLLQDREGFIWAGTKNGLNRFDGRRFVTFTTDPENPYALSHEYVTVLWEHGDFLLVGTHGGGLNIFHKKTQRFFRLPDAPPGGGQLGAPAIHRVAVDAQGSIWVVDWSSYSFGNLYHISLPPGFWDRLLHSATPWEGVSIHKHNDLAMQRFALNRQGDRLYYAQEGVLVEVDTRTAAERRFYHEGIFWGSPISADASGNIWVNAAWALLKLGPSGFTELPTEFQHSKLLFFFDDNQALIQTSEHELALFDMAPPGGVLRLANAALHFKRPMYVRHALLDRTNNVWMAFGGLGLEKVNLSQGRFRTYFPNTTVMAPPFSTAPGVYAIMNTRTAKFFSSHPGDRHPLIHPLHPLPRMDIQARYIQDREGHHWILYWDVNDGQHALLRVPASGDPYSRLLLGNKEGFQGNLTLDPNGYIWIGLNGLLHWLDPQTRALATFNYRAALPAGHEVRSFAQTAGGVWWIGTSHGLVEARPMKRAMHRKRRSWRVMG